MPWNTLGIWTNDEDADEGRQYARYQAELEQQERMAAMQHARQQQMYDHYQYREEQTLRNQPIGQAYNGGHAQQQGYIRQEVRPPEPNFLAILTEFNTAFQYGIREIVVVERVFHELMQYVHRQQRYMDRPEAFTGDHLILNMNDGPMKIIKEGAKSFKDIDFDRYMEEI